jgi:hypothetical protein
MPVCGDSAGAIMNDSYALRLVVAVTSRPPVRRRATRGPLALAPAGPSKMATGLLDVLGWASARAAPGLHAAHWQ